MEAFIELFYECALPSPKVELCKCRVKDSRSWSDQQQEDGEDGYCWDAHVCVDSTFNQYTTCLGNLISSCPQLLPGFLAEMLIMQGSLLLSKEGPTSIEKVDGRTIVQFQLDDSMKVETEMRVGGLGRIVHLKFQVKK